MSLFVAGPTYCSLTAEDREIRNRLWGISKIKLTMTQADELDAALMAGAMRVRNGAWRTQALAFAGLPDALNPSII